MPDSAFVARMNRREADLKKLPSIWGCADVEHCGYRVVASTVPGSRITKCPKCGGDQIVDDPGPSGPAAEIADRRERQRIEKNRASRERKATHAPA